MADLGACTLAQSVGNMGDLMIQRRIEGKSWAEIADEFKLSGPSTARTKFTKLTGITDYKIKGKELKNLVDNNMLDNIKGAVVKQSKKAIKAVDNAVTSSAIDPGEVVHDLMVKKGEKSDYIKKKMDQFQQGIWTKQDLMNSFDITGDEFDLLDNWYKAKAGDNDLMDALLKQKAKDAKQALETVKEGVIALQQDALAAASDTLSTWAASLGDDQLDDLLELYFKKNQTGYLGLYNKTGIPIKDIDDVVWNQLVKNYDGDVWKAYVSKPTSETGFKQVQELVYHLRSQGLDAKDIQLLTDIDENVIKLIVDGKWKVPQPGSTDYVKNIVSPPSYSYGSGSTYSNVLEVQSETPGYTGFNYETVSYWEDFHKRSPAMDTESLHMFKRYTGSEYRGFNAWLRKLGSKQRTDWDTMANAMSRGMVPLEKPARFTRKAGKDTFPNSQMPKAGDAFSDPAFLSSAVIKEGSYGGSGVKMIIDAPAGTMGRYVDTFSNASGEKEFIFDRNLPMVVTKVETQGNTWFVYLKVLV